jgi:hypothetical protein
MSTNSSKVLRNTASLLRALAFEETERASSQRAWAYEELERCIENSPLFRLLFSFQRYNNYKVATTFHHTLTVVQYSLL